MDNEKIRNLSLAIDFAPLLSINSGIFNGKILLDRNQFVGYMKSYDFFFENCQILEGLLEPPEREIHSSEKFSHLNTLSVFRLCYFGITLKGYAKRILSYC